MKKYLRMNKSSLDVTKGVRYEVVGETASNYMFVDDGGDRRWWPKTRGEHWFTVETEEDFAPITVLPDESLGGVLREYREVKRKANVGERIIFTGFDRDFNMDGVEILLKVGEILTVADRYDHRPFPENAVGVCVTGRPNIRDNEYVVLEPTDIVYVNDPDGVGRRYRMVDRKAVVGERVIITNPDGDSARFGDYSVGGTYVISRVNGYMVGEDVYVAPPNVYLLECECAVLEPVSGAETAPAPLSTRPATGQIAENIAALTAKVQALEDVVKRMDTQLRVAREDIGLIEEGVAYDIKSLETRVKALELGGAFAGETPQSAKIPAQKTPQEIRDEIVERAKADVKKLSETPIPMIKNKTDRIGFWPHTAGGGESYMPIDHVEFVVNREKRTVIALIHNDHGAVWLRGIAKCAPNDVFNAHIGRAISLRRALGLEVPAEYLSVPNPTEVRNGDIVRTYVGEFEVTCTASFVTQQLHDGEAEIIDDSREGADDSASSAQKGAAA